jgi:hypothetical protein
MQLEQRSTPMWLEQRSTPMWLDQRSTRMQLEQRSTPMCSWHSHQGDSGSVLGRRYRKDYLTAKDYLNSWTASTYQVQWEPVPKRQKHLAVGPGQGM